MKLRYRAFVLLSGPWRRETVLDKERAGLFHRWFTCVLVTYYLTIALVDAIGVDSFVTELRWYQPRADSESEHKMNTLF
jgi:hypothetical protein